jgi:hypothetical protein
LIHTYIQTIKQWHFATVAKQTQQLLNPHNMRQSLEEFLEDIPEEEERKLQDLGDDVILSLNAQHTALIPFTVDHFGGLGLFAVNILFHPQDSPIPVPP